MPRLPLSVGTHGRIRHYQTESGWRARTMFRDFDGVTRHVERKGRTKAASDRALKEALRQRAMSYGSTIQPSTRFREVAEQWFSSVQAAVEHGSRSPATADAYRSHLDRHVLPGLGELRIQETTVPRVDRFLMTVRGQKGAPTAKTARTVVSGVLGLAVRHGALSANPVGETGRIEADQRQVPRALTRDERTQLLAQLDDNEFASRKDLPELTRFMLATGVRIGEALAIRWPEVDLASGLVEVNFTVSRIKGRGLMRKSTKTSSGERTLPLPSWAVGMLQRRYASAESDDGPVFPDTLGDLRDPSNVRRDLRTARGTDGFAWVTSHVFRKTAATILDEAGLSARTVADQLGHSRPSLTQDVYMGRKAVDRATAQALEAAFDSKSKRNDGDKLGE